MKVWIVLEGEYFNDHALVESVYLTKKDAETDTRKLGFKYDSGQGYFCNEATQMYRKIFPMQVTERVKITMASTTTTPAASTASAAAEEGTPNVCP